MAPRKSKCITEHKPVSSGDKKAISKPIKKRRIQPVCEICTDMLTEKSCPERIYNGEVNRVCNFCCVKVKSVTGGIRLHKQTPSDSEQEALLRRAMFLFAQDPQHEFYIEYSHPQRCPYVLMNEILGVEYAAKELTLNFTFSETPSDLFVRAAENAIVDLVQYANSVPLEGCPEMRDFEKTELEDLRKELEAKSAAQIAKKEDEDEEEEEKEEKKDNDDKQETVIECKDQ
jgi:hypothetical protein